MKKDLLLKVLSLVIAIVTLCTCFPIALADNSTDSNDTGEIAPEFQDVSTLTGSVYRSGLYIHVDCLITTKSAVDYDVTIYLQKQNGNMWETKETWSTTKNSATSLTFNNKKLEIGGTYRAICYCTVGRDLFVKTFYQ